MVHNAQGLCWSIDFGNFGDSIGCLQEVSTSSLQRKRDFERGISCSIADNMISSGVIYFLKSMGRTFSQLMVDDSRSKYYLQEQGKLSLLILAMA